MNYKKGITVILTVWRRHHLEEQIQALLSQSQPPAVIWVQHMENHVDVDDIIKKYRDRIQYTHYGENRGVYGRFKTVPDVETEYVFIMDDDIIPGVRFLEVALHTSVEFNAVVSPNGRILDPETNLTETYVGDGDWFEHSFCTKDTQVDFGNNAWLFKTEWIDFFLQYPPLYRNNGEDIQLAASLKLQKNIDVYVPKQWVPYESGNIKRQYSSDEHALHKRQNFQDERIKAVQRFRDEGWALQKERPVAASQSARPLISVVMFCPAVNDHTCDSLQSIIHQSFSEFEFIIVCNDADHTLAGMLKELGDSRIRLIDTYEPIDKYVGLNIGCGLASGKYICLMDNDCLAVRERLKVQYEYMEQHSYVVASGSSCKFLHDDVIFENELACDEAITSLTHQNDFIEETLIMRNEVLKNMRYFRMMEGIDMFYALMLRFIFCGDISNIPACLVEIYSEHKKRKIYTLHKQFQQQLLHYFEQTRTTNQKNNQAND